MARFRPSMEVHFHRHKSGFGCLVHTNRRAFRQSAATFHNLAATTNRLNVIHNDESPSIG